MACGAAEPDVDQWEAGVLVPTRAQVLALARLTEFPPEFFYQPMPAWQLTAERWCTADDSGGLLCTGDVDDGGPLAPYSQLGLF